MADKIKVTIQEVQPINVKLNIACQTGSNTGNNGGSAAVTSVDGRTGDVVLSDLYDQKGAGNSAVTSHEQAYDHNNFVTAYIHSQQTHAPTDAEPNPPIATQAEIQAGVETATRSVSPKLIADAISALASNGGLEQHTDFNSFPANGVKDILYLDQSTGLVYRWDIGSTQYIQAGIQLGTSSTTAFRGDYGQIAYNHSQQLHAPSDAEANPPAATKAEMQAGTETALRSVSPKLVADAVAALASGSSSVTSVDGRIGDVTLSDLYDAAGTAASEVATHVNTAQHGTTAQEQAELSTAYTHSQQPHAPINAEANYPAATQAEMETGTETALRSVSPKLVADSVSANESVHSVDGRTGNVTLSDIYDAAGTAASEVATHASTIQHGTTTQEQAELSAAYTHSQQPHAPSNAEPNPQVATQTEMQAGVETALRSVSPKLVADAVAALKGGIDYTQTVSIAGDTTLDSAAVGRHHVCSWSASDYTVTLPTTGLSVGDLISFEVDSAATRLVTLDAGPVSVIDDRRMLVMWTGEKAAIMWDGDGWKKVSGESKPMLCKMALSADATLSSSAATKINVNDVVFDYGELADISSGRINIRRGGTYRVSASVDMSVTNATSVYVEITDDEGNTLAKLDTPATGGTPHLSCSGVAELPAGSYVELIAYQNSGSSETVYAGKTWLSVEEIDGYSFVQEASYFLDPFRFKGTYSGGDNLTFFDWQGKLQSANGVTGPIVEGARLDGTALRDTAPDGRPLHPYVTRWDRYGSKRVFVTYPERQDSTAYSVGDKASFAGVTVGDELAIASIVNRSGTITDNGDGSYTVTGGDVRIKYSLADLVDGATYRIRLEILSNTSSTATTCDWCDTSPPLTIQAGYTGWASFSASRSTYDSTYRFLDVGAGLSAGESITLIPHVYPHEGTTTLYGEVTIGGTTDSALPTISDADIGSTVTDGGVTWAVRGYHTIKGIVSCAGATNLFLNSSAPATQSITTTAQNYTVSVIGIGSLTLSGSATGTVTEDAPLTVTASAGTMTCTVNGSLDYVQVEAGIMATPIILTTGATATRTATNTYDIVRGISPQKGAVALLVTPGAEGQLSRRFLSSKIDGQNRFEIYTHATVGSVLTNKLIGGANNFLAAMYYVPKLGEEFVILFYWDDVIGEGIKVFSLSGQEPSWTQKTNTQDTPLRASGDGYEFMIGHRDETLHYYGDIQIIGFWSSKDEADRNKWGGLSNG